MIPDYLTTAQYAAHLGVSRSLVLSWLYQERIPGAVRIGPRAWAIPAGTPRPRPLVAWHKDSEEKER